MTNSITKSSNHKLIGWSLAGLLFLVPVVGSLMSDEVRWSLGDFVIFGGMLLVAGLAIELAARLIKDGRNRALAMMVVAILFVWLWAELAVGVFTNWGS